MGKSDIIPVMYVSSLGCPCDSMCWDFMWMPLGTWIGLLLSGLLVSFVDVDLAVSVYVVLVVEPQTRDAGAAKSTGRCGLFCVYRQVYVQCACYYR